MEMDSIRSACLSCELCGLAAGRTRLVFGDGNENAEVMFIGEGPGEQEDLHPRVQCRFHVFAHIIADHQRFFRDRTDLFQYAERIPSA